MWVVKLNIKWLPQLFGFTELSQPYRENMQTQAVIATISSVFIIRCFRAHSPEDITYNERRPRKYNFR